MFQHCKRNFIYEIDSADVITSLAGSSIVRHCDQFFLVHVVAPDSQMHGLFLMLCVYIDYQYSTILRDCENSKSLYMYVTANDCLLSSDG